MIQLNFCRCASKYEPRAEAAGVVRMCCASLNLTQVQSVNSEKVHHYEPVILHSTQDKSLKLGIKGLAIYVPMRLV